MDEITVSLTSQNIGPVGAEEVLVSGRETMDEMVETMDEMSAVATTAMRAMLAVVSDGNSASGAWSSAAGASCCGAMVPRT